EGQNTLSERSALVDQHQPLAPYDTQTSSRNGRGLERLHPHLDPELFGGPEQLVKEVRVVHLCALRGWRPQLFFAVCAMKPPNCGTTFMSLHVGHFGLAFSRSEMVMGRSKDF